MSANILDGRLVSDFLLLGVAKAVERLKKLKIKPKLVILLVGENPASESYIRQKSSAAEKTGVVCDVVRLPEQTTTKKLIEIVEKLNKEKSVHGILVQLPLPDQIDAPLVFRAIEPKKDADGFQAYNLGKMFLSREFENLVPCTPRGILHMLEYYKIDVEGKNAVIVGRSNIVGKPLAVMLINRNATVTVCHSKTNNIKEFTKNADLLICAVGRPKFITADMVKKGAIVVDVGINRVGDKLVGDCDFDEIKKKAKWITPVPGGVGPMTVACLMENVVRSAESQISHV